MYLDVLVLSCPSGAVLWRWPMFLASVGRHHTPLDDIEMLDKTGNMLSVHLSTHIHVHNGCFNIFAHVQTVGSDVEFGMLDRSY